ncbi:MAG: cation-translocating P-type ATPase [Elusimicrobiota bacterium]
MSENTLWHSFTAEEAVSRLGTDAAAGLTGEEAAARLRERGPNLLREKPPRSPWLILWDQFNSALMAVLAAAAAIAFLAHDRGDAAVIAAILVLNAALGFWQEFKADRAMEALKKMAAPSVRAVRDGRTQEIPAAGLVPGDVILVSDGDRFPADCRLLESRSLRADESALTGESAPVEKTAEPDAPAAQLADRRGMIYAGTAAVYGRGRGVVAATGMDTELGKIAVLLEETGAAQTPLQARLDILGRRLALAALAITAVIFAQGLLRGVELKLMFLAAVSLAVAAVPEGLPAVVTIALSLGARRMLARKALIRKLAAVETLGSVTVICSDKTGTLTGNRMAAREIWAGGVLHGKVGGGMPAEALAVLSAAALCSDAGPGTPGGDPTEAALVEAAAAAGFGKAELERALPRVGEAPFDPVRKMMSTLHRPAGGLPEPLRAFAGAGTLVLAKGAPERLLEKCSSVLEAGAARPLDGAGRQKILEANSELASRGMRVLAVAAAARDLPAGAGEAAMERDLTFLGLAGLIDPPRPETPAAVSVCLAAGMKPVMITGDQPLTARAVATEIGFPGGAAVTGAELDGMDGRRLAGLAEGVSVYARVSPEHKLRIVEALQERGHIVAMTGDGVNDAPALKKAHIGVAMGIAGTDVSKGAADMVLVDDNFSTIVAAVEEGRAIYDNILKFTRYLISCNAGEILVMFVSPFLGMPLALLPAQLLWMNLVTDGLPALAIGVQPAEAGVMSRPPRRTDGGVFTRGMTAHIIWSSALMCAVSLGAGWHYWRAGDPAWQTMLFTTLTLSQLAQALTVSPGRDLFASRALRNPKLLAATAASAAMQAAVIYAPFLREFFGTVPLAGRDIGLAAALAASVFLAGELAKLIRGNGRGPSGSFSRA